MYFNFFKSDDFPGEFFDWFKPDVLQEFFDWFKPDVLQEFFDWFKPDVLKESFFTGLNLMFPGDFF